MGVHLQRTGKDVGEPEVVRAPWDQRKIQEGRGQEEDSSEAVEEKTGRLGREPPSEQRHESPSPGDVSEDLGSGGRAAGHARLKSVGLVLGDGSHRRLMRESMIDSLCFMRRPPGAGGVRSGRPGGRQRMEGRSSRRWDPRT